MRMCLKEVCYEKLHHESRLYKPKPRLVFSQFFDICGNLEIVSAFVGLHLHSCILLQVISSVRPVDQLLRQLAHEGLLWVVLPKTRVGESVRRIRSALNRCWKSRWILDFSDVKHIFIPLLLAVRLRLRHYSFMPVKELNYRTVFSWKMWNIKRLFFIIIYVYFFENDLF